MGSMNRLPRCSVCRAPLGPRPWPVVVVADEPVAGIVVQALAEGRIPMLYLCGDCDEAVMAVLTTRLRPQSKEGGSS